MRFFLKFVKWAVLSALLLVAAVLLLFCCIEQRLPASLLARLCDRLSNENYLVCVDAVTFRLPHRIRIVRPRVLDRRKVSVKPFFAARQIEVRLSYCRLPWSLRNLIGSVRVEDAFFPKLPDGYYTPDSIEFPGSPDYRETFDPLAFDLPELDPLRLVFVRPRILGIAASQAEVRAVRSSRTRLELSDVRLVWPDADAQMSVMCDNVALDLGEQRLRGTVHGQARQRNIRPMLIDALQVDNAKPYFDGFTEVETPVDATCRFDVDLVKNDLHVFLDLHPTGGFYNGVPLKSVDGVVDVKVFVRGTNQNARIVAGPISAELADGGAMRGTVVYENVDELPFVSFRDVQSTTSLSNALAVADVLRDGTLDCLQPETPPTLRLDGIMAVGASPAASNHLEGTIGFAKGTLFGVPLRDARTGFSMRGTKTSFEDAKARMPKGGTLVGGGWVDSPDGVADTASFGVSIEGQAVALDDALGVFGISFGGDKGEVDGRIDLSGGLGTNSLVTLRGKGALTVRDGQIAQLKLFAGLTDYLAKNVPGVAALVNQSSGRMDFSISNGVMRVEQLLIEGKVFSVRASGAYDMVADRIDLPAQVRLFRNDSVASVLASPINWTFSNLLMNFHVTGSLDDPKWGYAPPTAAADKVLDGVKSLFRKK